VAPAQQQPVEYRTMGRRDDWTVKLRLGGRVFHAVL
jgi:hypothetical protein